MIQASEFIERASAHGFDWWAGVPCSFLTPFINYVIGDEKLTYVSAANEGDAVAAAAGAALGGRRAVAIMQNSGLGNAVSPLTSLTWVFRLPILLIITWRGEPGLADEPQHELMGDVTPAMLETMQIPWEVFPESADAIEPALKRVNKTMAETGRPYALIMKKGTVAEYALTDQPPPGHSHGAKAYTPFKRNADELPSRADALKHIVALTPEAETVVIATTGHSGRELYSVADRVNQLYMVGSMGCAPVLGLGLAMARPDLRVIVIDGDGAALMRLGAFATVGAYGGNNLVHLLLDNSEHASTGGQATVSAGMSFAAIASGCGYASVFEGDDLTVLDAALAQDKQGPAFAQLRIKPGPPADKLPRPTQSPAEIRARLMQHIGA